MLREYTCCFSLYICDKLLSCTKNGYIFSNSSVPFPLLHSFHNCHLHALNRRCSRTISIYFLLKYLEDNNFVLMSKPKPEILTSNRLRVVECAQVEEDELFLWPDESTIFSLLCEPIEILAISLPS